MGRRVYRKRKRKIDPAQQLLDDALRVGDYMPFYCVEHGKFLMLPGVRGVCPACGKPCFTPEEWKFHEEVNVREQRKMRVQLLRNFLE